METMQKELSKRATWRINQLEKNLTTNKKIDAEAEKAQKEIVKYEFAEQTLKEKPEVASQFIVSELDTIQKEHLAQDFINHGIIRSEKDANKINEDIMNTLKGKKKQKQKIIDPKVKLFKLTLENTLFQDENEKTKIKRIMSPKQSKSFIAQSWQNNIHTNVNGKERQEIVKELLHAQEMKSLITNENENYSNNNINRIKSLQQLPLDCLSPFSLNVSTTTGDQSGQSQNKKYKSMAFINTIHHDQQISTSNISYNQSITEFLKPKRSSLVSKYIQYDSFTPQNNGLIKEEMDPEYLSLNGQQDQQTDFDSNTIQKSKVKRIQSANPKVGGINIQSHHKFILFPSSQNIKLSEKEKLNSHSSSNLNNTIQQNLNDVKEEGKHQEFKVILEDENESPLIIQKPEFINKHRVIHPQNANAQQNSFAQEHNQQYLQSPQSKQSLQNIYNQFERTAIINTSPLSSGRRQSTLNNYDYTDRGSIIPFDQQQDKNQQAINEQNNLNKQIKNQQNPQINTLKSPENQVEQSNQNTKTVNKSVIKSQIYKGIKSKSICSFEMPKAHLMNNTQHKHHQFAQHIYGLDQVQQIKSPQNQTLKIEKSQTEQDEKISEKNVKDINHGSYLLTQQTNHNSYQIETDSSSQLQEQKSQQPSLFHKDYQSFKGKSNINSYEIIPGFSSYHPTTEHNISVPEQNIIKAKSRPQSSLIGSNTQQQLQINNLNQLSRQQKGSSLSNLCSPIHQKEGSSHFIPNLQNNPNLKFSILYSPQSRLNENKNESNTPNYNFSQTYAQANQSQIQANQSQLQANQTYTKGNQTNNSTQINLNGFSQMNFQQLHPNRSHVILTQMNNPNQLQRPRSYKKDKSVDKQESKNIHMDKLRFLKKDLELKDPFKNNNAQFKKLMTFTNQFFPQNQIPKSPKGLSYLKLQQN